MDIDVHIEGIQEIVKKLDPALAKQATAYTLNQAVDAGRSFAVKKISEIYNIKQKTIKGSLKTVFRASASKLIASFLGKGRGIPLIEFGARQRGYRIAKSGQKGSKSKHLVRGRQSRGDVTRLIKRTSGRKVEPSKYGNKPFMVEYEGRIRVWERKGKERFPV